MTDAQNDGPQGIGRWERRSLHLVFGGPASWWVPMARAVGVHVEPPLAVDDTVLADAERSALEASRRFGPGLAATAISVAALIPWLPIQRDVLEPIGHMEFHAIADGLLASGASFTTAVAWGSVMLLGISLAAGLFNLLVFGGIPLYFLRRCTVAAAPAVAVALAQGDTALDGPQAARYPRLALAAERMLYPRGR